MPGTQIIAIDCGTQSVRCLIVDVDTGAHSVGATESIALRPTVGNRIEVDPGLIAAATIRVLRSTLALCPFPISIAITNMRETAIAWDKKTGEPVHDGIMWMSQQSQNIVDRWSDAGLSEQIRVKTGLSNHTFFFGSKIAWLLDARPDIGADAAAGRVAVGTVDSWLLFVLTGGATHATDVSNASRYQLLNLEDLEWDGELAEALGIPLAALPAIHPTSSDFGFTDVGVVGARIPITGMIGDQQASLLGHDCVSVGDAKATFGTSCVVGVNLGAEATLGEGLVTSVAWSHANESVVYEMEGSAFHSGFTVTWLDRILQLPANSNAQLTRSSVPPKGRVAVVPSFTELGAPRWLKGHGASIHGLTMDTDARDILRAGIESMAFQAFDLVSAVPNAQRHGPLSVDGGAASNDYMCQLLADLANRVIVRPPSRELTGFGAARAAAAFLGIDIPAGSREEGACAQFVPAADRSYAEGGFEHWQKVTQSTLEAGSREARVPELLG